MSSRSLASIFDAHARVGPAYLWLAPPVNSTTGLVDLSLTGNDNNDLIPDGIPRPTSGGLFLGYDEQGVVEAPQVSYEVVPIAGSTVPFNVKIKEEKTTVKAKLLFNNDVNIVSLFRTQSLTGSLYWFTYGGATDVVMYPLLLILTNYLNDQDYVECHYYYRGYFDPASTSSGRLFSGLDMSYTAIAGLDANGCLLPAGARIMKGWYVRVDYDGTNTLIAPTLLNGLGHSSFSDVEGASADSSETSIAAYPFLFSGMGGI